MINANKQISDQLVKGSKKVRFLTIERVKAMFKTKTLILVSSLLSALVQSALLGAQDLPGATQTAHSVSSTGAFNFQVPIVAPVGTGGVNPNISLSFSNTTGNGPLGVGWSLSGLGAITRCPSTVVRDGASQGVTFSSNDRFCLNGSPLVVVSGIYGAANSEYRTEIDQFTRIKAFGTSAINVNGGTSPAWWGVWSSGGAYQEYGRNTNSRFLLPGTGTIMRWGLYRAFDNNDNYYTVSYEDSEGLPTEISYTHNATGLSADKKISFIYESQDRPDSRFVYRGGVRIDRVKRLDSIEVSKDFQVLRSYDIDYELAPVSQRSRIKTITECGLNNECMPPIELEWQQDQAGFIETTEVGNLAPPEFPVFATFSEDRDIGNGNARFEHDLQRGEWIDINGDGLTDLVIATQPIGEDIDSDQFDSMVFLKQDDGTWSNPNSQASRIWELPMPLKSFAGNLTQSNISRFRSSVINMGVLKDVNADGLIDVVYSFDLFTDPEQINSSSRHSVNETYLNTGNGWQLSQDYEPADIMFDYISNRSGSGVNEASVETTRSVLIDINGDGLLDWVSAYNVYGPNGTSTDHQSTWLNNGQGWDNQPTASYQLPDVFVEYDNGYTIEHGQFVDVNGDGLPDWVRSYEIGANGDQRDTWLNTGSGWESQPSLEYRLPVVIYESFWENVTQGPPSITGSFVDVNGDGLKDYIVAYAAFDDTGMSRGGQFAIMNTGRGWVISEDYKPPFFQFDNARSFSLNIPLKTFGLYIDLNRDGLQDYVASLITEGTNVNVPVQRTWMNTGNGWVEETGSEYVPDEIIFDYSNIAKYLRDAINGTNIYANQGIIRALSRGAEITGGSYVDINNDGIPDWVTSQQRLDGTKRISTKISPEHSVEQLLSITTTSGVVIKPTFMPLTLGEDLYIKGTEEPEEGSSNSISATYVVSQVETSRPDGTGFNAVTYQYEGAQINREGRGLLGFSAVTVTNVARDTATYTEYRQDFPFIGMADRSAVMVGNRTISATQNEYQFREIQHSSGQTTFFPYVSTTTSISDELQSELNVPFSTQASVYTYDDYGNIRTTSTEVKDAFGNLLREVSSISTYFPPIINTTDWFLNLRKDSAVTQLKPGEVPVTNILAYEYDDHGQIKKRTQEPNSNFELETTFEYDNFGNITKETLSSDTDGIRATTYIFDDLARFPEVVINAKNQPASTEYDFFCDLPSEVTDLNGLVSTIDYDNFCREIKITDPDGVETTTEYIVANGSNQCNGCQVSPVFITVEQVSDEPPVTSYFNAFNQSIFASTFGMFGETINARSEYDHLGRLVQSSQPYFQGDVEYTTFLEYDVLDRQVKTTFPYFNENGVNATQTQDYSVDSLGRSEVISTDTKGRATSAFSNALNQTIEIRYVNGTSLRSEYNSQLQLARTIDAAAIPNVTEIEYDRLGRRISLDDPDLGLSTYSYNDFNELATKTDAKQQTITYEYDPLGRVVEQTVPVVEGSGGVSTWVYDEGDNAIGQLSSVTGPNGYSRTYGYDEFARLEIDTSIIRGESYQQQYGYNEAGRISFKRYPDSGSGQEFSVHYNYANGFLTSVTDRNAGLAGCIEHWRADKYDALGRLAESTLGKIVKSERDYDDAQGVLNKIESNLLVGNARLIQDLNYTYDETNNVLSRIDAVLWTDESFEYDSQDRLRFHHTVGGESIEAQYNAIGNITYKSNVGTYNYNGDGGPHAVSSIDFPSDAQTSFDQFRITFDADSQQFIRDVPSIHGQQFRYDDNGNTEQSGNRSLFWTAFDKPYLMMAQKANGEQLGSYIEYDANQQRIYKEERTFNSLGQVTGTGERTVYLGSGYQRIRSDSGDITHRYTITVDGASIQIDRENGTSHDQPRYLLVDNLGSTNVVLNALGEVEQRLAFDPWGNRTNVGHTTSVNAITNRGFTGHEMDDETGLVNMNARIYDPYLGRFLSPDTIIQSPGDMQSYNRYSYVFNNPLKYTDPSGNIASFSSTTINTFGFVVGTPSSNAIPSVSVNVTQQVTQFFDGGGSSFSPSFTLGGGGNGDNGEPRGLSFGSTIEPFAFFTDINITITIVIDFSNASGGGGPTGGFCIAGACNNVSSVFGTDGAANNDDLSIVRFGDFTGDNGRARAEEFINSERRRLEGENRRQLFRDLGQNLFDELIGDVITDVASGALGAAACGVVKLCRGLENFGERVVAPIAGRVADRVTPIITGAANRVRDFFRRQCFVAGTPVHTKDGVKPIEEIKVGDIVASKNDKTGEVDWKPVAQLFQNHNKTVLNIGFIGSLGITETLGTTEEHPFWVEGKGWTNAGDLEVGDEITTLENGSVKVSTIATSSEKHTTYNFEVEDYHTYFVGDAGLWVHNMCKNPNSDPLGSDDPGLDDVVRQLQERGVEVENTNVRILDTNGNALGEVDVVTPNAVLQVKTISSAHSVIRQVKNRTEPFVNRPVVTFIRNTEKAGNRTVSRAQDKVLITNDIDELADLIR